MNILKPERKNLLISLLALFMMTAFAAWLKTLAIESSWQRAGMINFSLGLVLLAAYLSARILNGLRLPRISGYILTGIIAGPYITGFLTVETVRQFQLINDLALSFIALSAGGALHLRFLRSRSKVILLNIVLQTLMVFGLVLLFVMVAGAWFGFTRRLSSLQIMAFGILAGAVAVARSPSSAMALINECKASGTFTDTILGVTVALDVLVIVIFTLALTSVKILLSGGGMIDFHHFTALFMEISVSILIGLILGRGIAWYIARIGHDLPLFLLFLAFSVTKISLWLTHFMENHFGIFLNLEPLLICMSAGFIVQNFSTAGTFFMDTLDRMALPIYVLFFSVAGAALNLEALRACWPLAVCLVGIRMAGIALGTWLAGTLVGDPAQHNRVGWMAYLTQAGVAIGLAQLAQRHYPEIGIYLTTVVLAVISVNQVVGPITFKIALNRVGEAKK